MILEHNGLCEHGFLDGDTTEIHNYSVYSGILKHYVSHSYKPNSPREDSIREDYAYT